MNFHVPNCGIDIVTNNDTLTGKYLEFLSEEFLLLSSCLLFRGWCYRHEYILCALVKKYNFSAKPLMKPWNVGSNPISEI
jgi:hypothetical protein